MSVAEIRSKLPVFIVLAREPGSNCYKGLIENSFTMDWSSDRVRAFWTGKAYSILGEHQLDGQKDAEAQKKYYKIKHPDWMIEIFDARSPECPILINWEAWYKANTKYDSRNMPFAMREG